MPFDSSQINMLDELSNFVFATKYARYNNTARRRETYEEAVSRVEQMHLSHYWWLDDAAKERIRWAFDMVRDKRILPSMRSMQFGGIAIEAHNARIYNCAMAYVHGIRSFRDIMYLLLCGCGVGLGFQKEIFDRMPRLISRRCSRVDKEYVISDSIEGWAESIGALVGSYMEDNPWSGVNLKLIYDEIRPEGAPLKTGGGKAPGPEPLRRAHNEIGMLLDRVLLKQDRLKTIDAYDIIMHSSNAVMSGGVRRAATCALFDPDDDDMMRAKIGNWYETNPQRARSNNSVILCRDKVDRKAITEAIAHTRDWGEPGFVFANDPLTLYNPCFEIGTIPIWYREPTIQFCNLVTQNGRKIKSKEDFHEACEAAGIIGTLQAGYTSFPFLDPSVEMMTKSEALLGVSITGFMDSPDILLDPETLRYGASVVTRTNTQWSRTIGIRSATRNTCVKPEGSTSAVFGCASATDCYHSERFFRRVQINRLHPVYGFFKGINPHLCERSVWNPNGTDDVVTFPVEAPDGVVLKKDMPPIKHLETIAMIQENWVEPGTRSTNKKNVRHSVSCTVLVGDDQWEEVGDYLYENRSAFSAVSLLTDIGDKKYSQTPFESVIDEDDHRKFYDMARNYIPVDYTRFSEMQDETAVQETVACGGGTCAIV